MNKDDELLKKRIIELSHIAYNKDIVCFSDFLNLNELNILHTLPKNLLSTNYELFGGYELAERQMVAFIPDALCYTYNYPLSVLKITPLNSHFAEELTHRDYLGALLNLGIDRSKVGDIIVKEKMALVFIHELLCDFVREQLIKIKHTMIKVTLEELEEIDYHPNFEEKTGTVSSLRLDSVLSVGFPLSRSKIVPLIEGGRVFVDGKLVTNNGHPIKEGNIISVRKLGRIRFDKALHTTKKGRIQIQISKYV